MYTPKHKQQKHWVTAVSIPIERRRCRPYIVTLKKIVTKKTVKFAMYTPKHKLRMILIPTVTLDTNLHSSVAYFFINTNPATAKIGPQR